MPESDGTVFERELSLVTRDTELRMRRARSVNSRKWPEGLRTRPENRPEPTGLQKGTAETSAYVNREICEIRGGNSDPTSRHASEPACRNAGAELLEFHGGDVAAEL